MNVDNFRIIVSVVVAVAVLGVVGFVLFGGSSVGPETTFVFATAAPTATSKPFGLKSVFERPTVAPTVPVQQQPAAVVAMEPKKLVVPEGMQIPFNEQLRRNAVGAQPNKLLSTATSVPLAPAPAVAAPTAAANCGCTSSYVGWVPCGTWRQGWVYECDKNGQWVPR